MTSNFVFAVSRSGANGSCSISGRILRLFLSSPAGNCAGIGVSLQLLQISAHVHYVLIALLSILVKCLASDFFESWRDIGIDVSRGNRDRVSTASITTRLWRR